jgi:hypothetical protein
MSTTWDPVNKNASIALSNGNLTATHNGTPGLNIAGRAIDAATVTTGQKIYWLTQIANDASASDGTGAGCCTAAETFADGQWLGNVTTGFAIYDDGKIYQNGVAIRTLTPWVEGTWIGHALWGKNRYWVSINGVWQDGDPNTLTGGLDVSALADLIPAYNVWNQAGVMGVVLANFGATALAFPAPTGFTTLDSVPAAPVANSGGGAFRHIGRHSRDELEPEEEAVTVATTEELPTKPLSRKMRKRLAAVAKQSPNDDEEEEAMMLLLAA